MSHAGTSLYQALGEPASTLGGIVPRLREDGLRSAAAPAGGALRLLDGEIQHALQKILGELDLLELAVRAWATLDALRKYRDRDKFPPDVVSVISLAGHTVRSRHEPSIELLLNGSPLASLTLELEFAAVFEGVALTIRDARIRRIATGKCRVEASLAYKNNVIWKKATPDVALPGTLDLGHGIEIPAL